MDPAYIQSIHSLLEAILSPDTATIKRATAELNTKYYRSAECVPGLFEVGVSSGNDGVRQLASTELRKRILAKDFKFWQAVPLEFRTRIKQGLLERLLAENVKIVRHGIARAIAAIADYELYTPSTLPSSSTTPSSPSQWPELIPFLTSTCSHPSPQAREAAIFVLFTILDTVRDSFVNDMMGGMFGIFGGTLGDQDGGVRLITLRALGKVAEYIEVDQQDFIRQYQSLMPRMLQVLHQTVLADDTEGVKLAFDVFETCLIMETPLINKNIRDYVDLCLGTAGKVDADEEIRNAALNSLSWTIQYKKGRVQSLGLAGTIIERLLPIGAEEDQDDDDDFPSKLAFRTLDELAKALPPTQVFPVLSAQLQSFMSSGDPAKRKSALMAFGVTIEGCSEFIRPHIGQLWPLIDSGLNDQDPMVRKAGCIALACMCEWLQEECADRHAQLVPALFNLVGDADTQKSATAALEAYLEILGPNIASYLTLLMEKFVGLLDTAPISIKITVTGAIGSAAFASKEGFQPYFPETIRRIVPFLLLQGEGEESTLRGVALDTMGTFAEVVGKDVFRPHFNELMQYAIAGLQSENARMKESSLMFFGTMAGVFEEEFAPYLAQTVPALIASVKQTESDQFTDDNGNADQATIQKAVAAFNAGSSSGSVSLDNGDESDDDDEYEDLDGMMNINSEIAIEKEISAEVIGQVFEATRNAFMPFLEESINALLRLLLHYYEGIRKSALSSLFAIIRTFYEMSDPADWEGKNTLVPFHAQVAQVVDMIMPAVMELWETEDDQQVNILLCSALSETITTCGPALIEGRRDAILGHVKAILNQQHECQQLGDAGDEEAGGETSEYEAVVISNAVDVVSAMSVAYGPAFAPEFSELFPLVTKYFSPERTTNERSMVIGTMGEIIVGLKSGVTQFTQPILALLSKALQDSEPEVRSNAAFASGALIEWSEADLTGQFGALMQVLQGYFAVTPESHKDILNAKDNAVGCVARMILKSATSLPLEAVLPIFFGGLPLKQDPIENKVAFQAVFLLFDQHSQLVVPHIDHLLSVFAYVLDPSRKGEITVDTQTRLPQLIGVLKGQFPDKVAQAGLA